MTNHRVAVVRAASRLFDLPQTVRRFRELLGRAAREGAELVVSSGGVPW